MYPNKVFKIFNVSTPLAISFFFDVKWLTCPVRVFFGTKFSKLSHIHVLILKMTTFFFKKKKKEKRKKKKGSGRGNPHGPFGGDSPHLATSQIGAVEPHSSLMGVDRPPPWPNGGGRTTLMGCRGGSPPHFDQMVVDRASHWSNGGGHPFFFLK
jgi:hypothetical protein